VHRLSYTQWTEKQAGGTAYTDIGHEELWWTHRNGYEGDNGHLEEGDLAYLVGEVTDRYSGDDSL
jgi:hypothetical protein